MINQLQERASAAEGEIELLGKLLRQMRGDMDEEEFLLRGDGIGGYPTCLRGLAFEREHRDWCLRIAAVLRERRTTHAER